MLDQVFPGGAIHRYRAGGRDVIGCNRVAKERQHPGRLYRLDRRNLRRHALEERRLLDVSGVRIPLVEISSGNLKPLPHLVSFFDVGVFLFVHFGLDGLPDSLLDLLLGRPDILQVDRLAVRIVGQRLRSQVDVHTPGQRIRYHQRRRCQVIGLSQRVDPAFEVPVATENCGGDQIAFLDRLGNRLRQWAAVPDAGSAAKPDHVEAKRFQVREQSGFLQILRDDPRAGRKARLDVRLDLEPPFHCFLGDQTGGDDHRRVGGIGAARDRGNDHRAVLQLVSFPVDLHRYGFAELFVLQSKAALGDRRLEGSEERLLHLPHRDLVLRALRPSEARHHCAHVELEHIGVFRIRSVVEAE